MNKVKLDFLGKIIAIIKRITWKNNNVIYINSNKKIFDKENIDNKIPTRKYEWISCQTISKLGIKLYRIHLFKMKINLFNIMRNCTDDANIVYSGYVSPMFAAYDGYCLGDTRKYTFVDTLQKNSKPYVVNYTKNFSKHKIFIPDENLEINIKVCCTNSINDDKCLNNLSFDYTKEVDKVNNKILNEIYSFVRNVLDACTNSKVVKVNLYIAAKQPISFICGTAIQSYHPLVVVYEYDCNKYLKSFEIQNSKIQECDNYGKRFH